MDWTQYMQAVLALIFVIGLIGALIVVLRRLGFGAPTPTIGHRNKRVRVMEVTNVDARRRLVLVRHDDREHLILLGQNGETVVESRDAPDEAVLAAARAAAPAPPASFGEALGQVMGTRPKDTGKSGDRETGT